MKPIVWLLFLLGFLCLSCTTAEQRQRMAQVIAEADSLNRHYIPMTCDSLLLQACHYYDRHGSSNERMRAHYLLGCAYRDMGEAPQALECYQDAIAAADTTAADCDYCLMMSINGQMAGLFHAQNLPQDELVCWQHYSKYAMKFGDKHEQIRGSGLLIRPYLLLKDTARVIKIIEETRKQYLELGDSAMAVNHYSTLIHLYIEQGKLDKAHQLMCDYERLSGFFDADGNLLDSRRILYFYIKCEYYLKKYQLDSAEYYIRKIPTDHNNRDAYRGLLTIYRERVNVDTVFKYAKLYEDATDSLNDAMRTDILHRMSALYDYHRFQKESEQKAREAFQTRLLYGGLAILLLLCLLCLLYRYRRLHEKHEAERMNYEKNLLALSIKEQENTILRKHEHDNKELIVTNEEEIRRLKGLIKDYERLRKPISPVVMPELKKLPSYQLFHTIDIKGGTPSGEEWQMLFTETQGLYPKFGALVRDNCQFLSDTEYKFCHLIRIRFSVKGAGVLFGFSSAYASKLKRKILLILFGQHGSASELDRRLLELDD